VEHGDERGEPRREQGAGARGLGPTREANSEKAEPSCGCDTQGNEDWFDDTVKANL
jgi:hypothetical protein